MSEQSPTIALVHGAFAESASWNGVVEQLQRQGHDVVAVANPLRSVSGDAAYVRDARIPLEMAPSSNLQTGAARSVGLHPISLLTRLRFRVTLNTDNRLMSDTSMSHEAHLLMTQAGWTLEDLRWVTINAMKSAFVPFDQRLALIDGTIKPGYAAAGIGA